MKATPKKTLIDRLEGGPLNLRWRGKFFPTKSFIAGDVVTLANGIFLAETEPQGEPGSGTGWAMLLGVEDNDGL